MAGVTRHVVLCTLPGYGHVTPVLDVLGELVRRGHRVTVATGSAFADRIAATGARPLGYDEPAGDPGSHRLAAALTGASSCLGPLAPVRKLLADDPPDVLAFDSTMWIAGRVLAHDVAGRGAPIRPRRGGGGGRDLLLSWRRHVLRAGRLPVPDEWG